MNRLRPPSRAATVPPAGIYLHWPYCISKCTYCDFVTGPERGDQPARYAAALLREIAALDTTGVEDLTSVDTLYWGGGTPSLMSLNVCAALLDACRRKFEVVPAPEITLEANPGTLTREKAEGFRRLGVNRISLGVESLHDAELATLNRGHNVRQALETFEVCRQAGFDNINCDLICGLPEQSDAQWQASLRGMVSLNPEHISVYLLEFHPRTRMYGEVRTGKIRIPSEEELRGRYYACLDLLEEAGYEHYEISNFARSGCRSRHNLKYWEAAPYAGFGVGSHSRFGGRHISNRDRITGYIQQVEETGNGSAESAELSFEGWLGDYAITALRKREGIDLGHFRENYGFCFYNHFREHIDTMIRLEMLEIAEGRLRLTREALLVSNAVFEGFV